MTSLFLPLWFEGSDGRTYGVRVGDSPRPIALAVATAVVVTVWLVLARPELAWVPAVTWTVGTGCGFAFVAYVEAQAPWGLYRQFPAWNGVVAIAGGVLVALAPPRPKPPPPVDPRDFD